MASCTIGPNLSPGHMWLDYVHVSQSVPHKCSVRVVFGTDITDIINLRTDANDWADKVADCLTSNFHIVGWGIRDNGNSYTYSEPFGSPYPGTHSAAAGMPDAVSSTVTFNGRGIPASPGLCTGPARLLLHTGNTYLFSPRLKSIPATTDPFLDALATFLLSHEDLWADYYGQIAGVNGKYTVQYNATVQKKLGT